MRRALSDVGMARTWRFALQAHVIAGFVLVFSGCGIAGRAIQDRFEPERPPASVRGGSPAAIDRRACGAERVEVLTCDEKLWAEAAWKYVELNTNERTGLVNSTDKRPVVTMWDVGDSIAAIYAARELGLIDTCTFDARFGRIVGFLNTMPLVDELAPNRWYDAAKGTMTDVTGKDAVTGWSSVDLGRLLVWLRIVEARHPVWSEYIGRALARWNYCAIVDACGTLNRGIHTGPAANTLEQEGRLGYEEYAAAGFALWGFDTRVAAALAPSTAVTLEGIGLLRDERDVGSLHRIAPLTTTPFGSYEMELGGSMKEGEWSRYRDLGRSVANAQYARHRRTGTMTARGHRPLATPPWIIYDTLQAAGHPWNTVDAAGTSVPWFALLSTATVFELWAAFPDVAADQMQEFTCSLRDPGRGWLAGRFERTGAVDATHALRTNAAVLESILYRKFGTIYQPSGKPGWFELNARDEFFRPGRCLPGEQRRCGEECPPRRSITQARAGGQP